MKVHCGISTSNLQQPTCLGHNENRIYGPFVANYIARKKLLNSAAYLCSVLNPDTITLSKSLLINFCIEGILSKSQYCIMEKKGIEISSQGSEPWCKW